MAIRLRKIQSDSTLNVDQIAHKKTQKKTIWRRARQLTIIIFFVIIACVIYFYEFSPITGTIIVEANSIDVKTPVNALIKSVVSETQTHVEKGDVIAELAVEVGNPVTLSNNLKSKQIDLEKINIELADVKARVQHEKTNLADKTIEYKLAYELAKGALKRGKNSLEKAKLIFEARKDDLDRAERLWNLDAIAKGDLLAAKRMFVDADTSYKNARLSQKSLEAEYDAAKQAYDTQSEGAKENIDSLQKLYETTLNYKDKVEKEIARMQDLISGAEYTIKLKAPMTGIMLNKFSKVGEYISEGQILATIYNPKSIKLHAYINERYKTIVKTTGKVKAKIDKDYFTSKITYVKPQIVAAPPALKNRILSFRRYYFFVVELDKTNAPENLYPGEIGRAIFKRKQSYLIGL